MQRHDTLDMRGTASAGLSGHSRQAEDTLSVGYSHASTWVHKSLQTSHSPFRFLQRFQPFPPSPRTLASSYPPLLLQTRVTREPGTCWPCSVTPKVRQRKAEPPSAKGRGMPLPPCVPHSPPPPEPSLTPSQHSGILLREANGLNQEGQTKA